MKCKEEAFALLREWCDTLMTYTGELDTPYLKGALLCPACAVVHGRIADLVFPFTLLYKLTGEEKYYTAAKKYVAWSERNLFREDGTVTNDVNTYWKGISAFYAMSLGETLVHCADVLDAETRADWEAILKRVIYACAEYFESKEFSPVINYYAGAAAMFALGYRCFGDAYLLDKAKYWEEKCHACFDENGLFFGEGHNHSLTETSPKGCRAIDMGYNLEESLPLLLQCAHALGDRELWAYYAEKAKAQLHFVLPDGAVDDSFGTRSNKWTYWGSRTSDGIPGGYALLAGSEPTAARACLESLRLYRKCTHGGLLHQGPMSHLAEEPACIHHTFTHAKALAAFLVYADEDALDRFKDAALMREQEGVCAFQNGNLYTVTRGDFIATVNACDEVNYFESDNGGGAITLLYHKKNGPILAATPHTFVQTEPFNMQYPRRADKVYSQTARFLAENYSSDTDRTVRLSRDGYAVTAVSDTFPLSVRYDFEGKLVRVTLQSARDGEYILPIICSHEDTCVQKGSTVVFRDLLTVSASGDVRVELYHGKRFFHPVCGFEYVWLRFPVRADRPLVLTLSL